MKKSFILSSTPKLKSKALYMSLLLLMFFAQTSYSVTFWSETFPGGNGDPATDINTNDVGVDWTTVGGEVKANVWETKNTTTTWTSETISLCGYTNISLSVPIWEQGDCEASDRTDVYYSLDGGAFTLFTTNGTGTGNYTSQTASQTGLNGSTIQIRVIAITDHNSEQQHFDDIIVAGTAVGAAGTLYSVASGNINSACVWSNASGGAAGYTPANDGTQNLVIEGGFTVNMNVDYNLRNVTVGSTGNGILRWTAADVELYLNNNGATSSLTVASGSSVTENGQTNAKIILENANDGATDYTITINDNATGILIDNFEINGDNATVTFNGAGKITINDDFLFDEDNCAVTNNLSAFNFAITDDLIFGDDDDDSNIFTNNGAMTIGDDIIVFTGSDDCDFNATVSSTTTITDDISIDHDNFDMNNAGALSFDDYTVVSVDDDNHDIVNSGTINFDAYSGGNANSQTFTNTGTVNQSGTFSNLAAAQSSFVNSTNGIWNYAGTGHDPDILLDCAASPNTFNYNRGTAQGMINVVNDDYHHLQITNANTKTAVENMDIAGDLTISGSAVFDVGTGGYDITIAGNWLNSSSGGFTEGTRRVTFDGTGAQGITCSNIGTETFDDLYINKSDGSVVTMNNAVSVTDDFNFSGTNGYLNQNGNALTFTTWTTGDISGHDVDEFIYGGTISYTGVDNGEILIVPIGASASSTAYALATLTMTDGGDGNFSASLGGSPAATDVVDYTWNFTSTSTNSTMTVQWHSSVEQASFDRSVCALMHGPTWDEISQAGGVYTAAAVVGGGYYSKTGTTTSFSPYAVQDQQLPLPIELLNFDVEKSENNAKVNWATAAEINNDYFIIERSADGKHFEEVGKVSGAGNSTTEMAYDFTDENLSAGVYYYRLTQVDYDGKSETFPMVSVVFEADLSAEPLAMDVFPNPVNKGSGINVRTSGGFKQVLLVMNNALGQEFYVKTLVDINNGQFVIETYDIPTGVYIITASSNDSYVSKKVIVR